MIRVLCMLMFVSLTSQWLLAADDGVSHQVPDVIKKQVLPHLTSLEEVLKKARKHRSGDESGVILLREKYYWVTEEGRRFRIYHNIYQVKTEQGVESLSRDNFGYDEKLIKVHLAKARTVLPNGESKPLADNAAFIQRGRGSHSDQLYNSNRELVLIYPDVKVGSITECVVIYEDIQPRIPQEMLGSFSLASGWPIVMSRLVVDLPEKMAERLKTKHIATQVRPERQAGRSAGRSQIVWQQNHSEGEHYEPNRAPSDQAGPAIQFCTLESWETFGQWYRKLIQPQQQLSEKLQGLADEWTKDAKSRDEVIRILFQRVANDVRYTGLEFGISGLKPYSCDEVWDAQYGDCKDKSNLLCALLTYKGIPAYITLVNTEHRGVVHREVPGYHAFNHAIAAIAPEKADGRWMFCDPTINYGKPGQLSPSSSNRDVLIVSPKKVHWQKTPESTGGQLHYAFDLTLNAQGTLSGWMTLSANGFYGISVGESYQSLERQSVLQKLNDLIEPYYAGAVVADYVLPVSQGKQFPDPVVVKAYFTCPVSQPNEQGRLPLRFPSSSNLFLDYGDHAARNTDFFQWRDTIRVSASIQLPSGWVIDSKPQPLDIDTPYYAISASWNGRKQDVKARQEAPVMTMRMDVDCLSDLIPANQIGVVQQANRALAAWLQKPALLTKNAQLAETQTHTANEDVELSLMPTGKGQMDLVNRLYPSTGSLALRELALKKALQFFPNDRNLAFVVASSLAHMKYSVADYQSANKMYAELLARPTQGVEPAEVHYARYIHAMSLYEVDEKEKAIELLTQLAKESDLSNYREGWTLALLGDYLATNTEGHAERAELAIQQYEKALEVKSNHTAYTVASLYMQRSHAGQGARAAGEFIEWISSDPKLSQEILDELDAKLNDSNFNTHLEPSLKVLAQVIPEVKQDAKLKDALSEMLKGHQSKMISKKANVAIRTKLLALIDQTRPSYLRDASAPQGADSREKVEAAMQEYYNEKHAQWLTTAAYYFRTYPADDSFTKHLWDFYTYVKWQEYTSQSGEKPVLFEPLTKLVKTIPTTDPYYWECLYVTASWHEEHDRWEEALKIFEAIPTHPDYDEDFRITCWARMGAAYERLGRWEDAIRAHTQLADERDSYESVCEQLLRAGMLQLRIGKPDAALATWRLLASVPKSTWDESVDVDDIKTVVQLMADEAKTKQFWSQTNRWWNEELLPLMQTVGATIPDKPLLYNAINAEAVQNAVSESTSTKKLADLLAANYPVLESARWLPSRLSDVQLSLYNPSLKLKVADFRKNSSLLIGYYKAVQSGCPPELLPTARLMEVAILIDAGHNEESAAEALKNLQQLEKLDNPDREQLERTTLIYMLAIQRAEGDLKDAIARAEQLQESPLLFIEKNMFARHYCQLLNQSGQTEKCLEVVQQSIAGNATKDSNYHALVALEKQLRGERFSREGFGRHLTSWVKANQPAWFAEVDIKSLDDDRLPGISELIDGDRGELSEVQFLKALLLVAQSPELEIGTRQEAFLFYIAEMVKYQTTWDDAVKLVTGAIKMEPGFENINRRLIWTQYVDHCYEGRLKQANQLRRHPAYELVQQSVRETTGVQVHKLCQVIAKNDAQAILWHIEDATAEPMDKVKSGNVYTLIEQLISYGALEQAEEVASGIKNWKLKAEQSKTKLALRLELKQTLRTAKRQHDVVKQLYAANRERIENLAKSAPDGWDQYVRIQNNQAFSPKQLSAVDASRWMKTGWIDQTDLSFWMTHTGFWLYDEEIEGLDAKAFANAMETILKSDLREDAKIGLLAGLLMLNMHDGPAMKAGSEILNREDLPTLDPKAQAALQLFVEQSQRYSGDDPVTSLDMLKLKTDDTVTGFLTTATALMLAISEGKKPNIERVLEDADSNLLLDDHLIHAYLQALIAIGDDDLVDLVKEQALDNFQDDLSELWLKPNVSSFASAVDVTTLLECESLISERLIQHIRDNVHEDRHAKLDLLAALLRKDWKKVLEAGDVMLEEDEDRSHLLNYAMGMAHQHSGNVAKAREFFTPLSKKNPIEHTYILEARKHLKQMEGK
ncbi:DUF3857 domain-containing protein [Verrucomicrobiaceae bacterium R5-34]|nr:DUF3857 domain-containing protein [Verrucomicrobiaceae bacterium R5-34]